MKHHWPQIYKFCARHFQTHSTLSRNHYDALGLTPKATQADIKSAYYKLSMIYHPDKSKDGDDADKFRSITEAYEVLGNVKTRRLYDKGMLMGAQSSAEPENKFYKSREMRTRPPPPGGRTPIYDFDEWSKMHYSQTFVRSQETKRYRAQQQKIKEESTYDTKAERTLFVIALVFLICTLIIRSQPDYDEVVVIGGIPVTRTDKEDEKGSGNGTQV